MRYFQHMSFRIKVIIVVLAAGLLVMLPSLVHAGLGSDRPTITYTGDATVGFDHVAFNSFINVPDVGDERNFLHARQNIATGNFLDPVENLKSGDEILVRVYVDNNADPNHNADGSGVAKNARVRVELPSSLAQSQLVKGFVSADNAQPQIIQDDLTLTSMAPMNLEYETGSARLKTNFQDRAIGDEVISTGVLVGDDNLSGNQKGGLSNTSLVTFKLKVISPVYAASNQVKLFGAANYSSSLTTHSGDKVEFIIGVKDTGTTNIEDVVLGDRLPTGLKYIPNTTEWISGYTNNIWTLVSPDNWMAGGLNVRSYSPGGATFLRFAAQVDDSALKCGTTDTVNTSFAKAKDQAVVSATSNVAITKDCAPVPTPPPITLPVAPPAPTPPPVVPPVQPVPTPPAPSPAPTRTPPAVDVTFTCSRFALSCDATRTVKVTEFETTVTNGAIFKQVVINWGDGSANLTTNNVLEQAHQYGANGKYTITVTAFFIVNNQEVSSTSPACTTTAEFIAAPAAPTPPPVTPKAENPAAASAVSNTTALPNTGAGDIITLFVGTVIASVVVCRLYLARRLAR